MRSKRIQSAVLGLTCGAMLLTASVGAAQPASDWEQRSKVARIDRDANVLVLEDGRMYRVTPTTVVLVDNQPAQFSTIQPGTAVVVRSGEPVVFRDGQYVVVTQGAPGTVITTTPAPAATTPAPASSTVVVASAAPLKQTLYGRVTEIDRNGEVTVKTPKGEFEVRVSPDAARTLKKGDTVTIDVTFASVR